MLLLLVYRKRFSIICVIFFTIDFIGNHIDIRHSISYNKNNIYIAGCVLQDSNLRGLASIRLPNFLYVSKISLKLIKENSYDLYSNYFEYLDYILSLGFPMGVSSPKR
jgi:hypothetical protein